MNHEQKEILKLRINVGNYSDALEKIKYFAENKNSSYTCFANVHMLMEARRDANFRNCVNNAAYTFPDGVPIVYALKKLYGIRQDRIAGIDFMMDFLNVCEAGYLSVFLFGSSDKVLERLTQNILHKYPAIQIAGSISPPFRVFTEKENTDFINEINRSGANVVFVSLGCPKQEMWMAEHYSKINAVLLGVGAAFEIHAGIRNRAPAWMQRSGLEWIFRLVQEPSRLWKRYFTTNTNFLFLLLKEILKTQFRKTI